MPEDRESESPLREKRPESSGEFLLRVLKPAGCILVLVIMVLYFIICFTYKKPPETAPADTGAAQTVLPETETKGSET